MNHDESTGMNLQTSVVAPHSRRDAAQSSTSTTMHDARVFSDTCGRFRVTRPTDGHAQVLRADRDLPFLFQLFANDGLAQRLREESPSDHHRDGRGRGGSLWLELGADDSKLTSRRSGRIRTVLRRGREWAGAAKRRARYRFDGGAHPNTAAYDARCQVWLHNAS